MFGNRIGWLISACLAAVLILVVWWLGTLNVISPPSVGIVSKTGNVSLNLASHPELLDPIALPFDPQAIVPSMTEAKDPAPIYRDAIKQYIAAKSEQNYVYRDLFQSGKPKTTDLKELPILQLLIDARNCKPAKIFTDNPADVIDYDPAANERLESLYALGKTTAHLALYIQKDQPQNAMLLAEAAFALGAKMCEERLRWREFEAGAEIARDSAFVIKALDPARATAADIDPQMRKLLKDRCIPMWTDIGSIDDSVIARTAGDVFFVAKNAKEQMWRTEAILKLGRNKISMGDFGRGADQRWAKIIVRRMSNDASLDPITRTAAKAAFELTRDGYAKIST